MLRISNDSADMDVALAHHVLGEKGEWARGTPLATAGRAHSVCADPRLQGQGCWHFVTRDMQPLYAQFGFAPLTQPERPMQRHGPEIDHRG